MHGRSAPRRPNDRRTAAETAEPVVARNLLLELSTDILLSTREVFNPTAITDLLDRSNNLTLNVKHTDKDVNVLLASLGRLSFATLSPSHISSIASFVCKCAAAEPIVPNITKCAEMATIFYTLILEVCRLLREPLNVRDARPNQTNHMDMILRGVAVALRCNAPILAASRHNIIAVLLLLHNHVCVTGGGTTPAALLDALKSAYLLPQKTVSTTSTEEGPNGNCQLFDNEVANLASREPTLFTDSTAHLNTRVVEVLIQYLHSTYNYLSKLPPAAPVTTEGLESSVLVCNNATAELRLLIASLQALHSIFEQANSAKNSTLELPGQFSYLSLVLSIDKLLRNVMPTLSKKLSIIAEAAATYQATQLSTQLAAQSASLSTTPNNSSQSSIAVGAWASAGVSSPVRTAYRPPSQRNLLQSSTGTAATSSVPAPAATIVAIASTASAAGAVSVSVSGRNSASSADLLGQYTVTFAALKVQVSQNVLMFLGSLAAHSPSVFLQSWPLFLTDTLPADAHLEAQCQEIMRSVMTSSGLAAPASVAVSTVNSRASIATTSSTSMTNNNTIPVMEGSPLAKGSAKAVSVKLISPILGTMLHSTTVAVRTAAVGALIKVLMGLQLRTYFSTIRPGTVGRIDTRSSSTSRVSSAVGRGVIGQASKETNQMSKQLKTLFKIIQVVIVMLQSEQREEVLELLLKLASLLLNHMPLSDNWKPNKKVIRPGFALNDANSLYESHAVLMYHLILKLALRYEMPSAAVPILPIPIGGVVASAAAVAAAAEVNRPVVASYVAMCWISERCKQLDQSHAFAQALQMAYLPLAQLDINPSIRNSATASTATVSASGVTALSRGGQGFMYAAVHCLLRAVPPHATNNLYCITVRTLNTVLAQYHSGYFLRDPQWLCSLLTLLENHILPALRLQGTKMLASLFEHDLKTTNAQLDNAPAESKLSAFLPLQGDYLSDAESSVDASCHATYERSILVGRSMKSNVVAMLTACTDDAHIVRTQAMLTLTSLNAYIWRVLHKIPSSSRQQAFVMKGLPGADVLQGCAISVRVVLLRVLLIGAADAIGTVRAAAYKSLGDCVVHNALLLSAAPRPGRNVRRDGTAAGTHPLLSPAEELFMQDLFRLLAVGIVDTKLAVRIQAAWALGNVLVNVLPYRWEHLARSADVSAAAVVSTPLTWLSDECWLSLYKDLLPLLRDSDKVLATAVRCIGNVVAGMRPQYAQTHCECLVNLHTSLIQEFLVPEYGLLFADGANTNVFDWRMFENVKTPILEQSQKLTFALSQSMGFIFHTIAESWEFGVVSPSHTCYVSDVIEVQMNFLKYSKLKVQLQAAQVLLYATAKHNALVEVDGSGDDGAYEKQLIRLLECLFVLSNSLASTVESHSTGAATATPTAPRAPQSPIGSASNLSSVPGAAALALADTTHKASVADQDETREEVVQLMRSRATQLVHYFILLLHTVLAQLAAQVGVSGTGESDHATDRHRAVLELLLYYGDSITAWLESQHAASSGNILSTSSMLAPSSSAPSFCYGAANTSVGLPHVKYDVCAALGCEGKTPQILVAEICLTLLQFSLHHPTITNTSATTESPTEPLYASEKLPSALVTRLARVAHNAPAAVKDSSLDDILYGTDVSFGAGNSYGVFDGLAPQHYLYSLPVGTDGTGVQSPPQSPGKSIRGMYSSPDNQAGGGLSNTVSPNFGYAVHSAEDDEDEF